MQPDLINLRPASVRARPGDQRQFIHKKLLGGISKVAGFLPIPGAGVISRVAGALSGGGAPRASGLPAHFPQNTQFFRPGGGLPPTPGAVGFPMATGVRGLLPAGPSPGPCPAGTFPTGNINRPCVAADSPLGAAELGGDAIAGRYGAGFVAGSRISDTAVCPRGTKLGNDGICYAKLANKDRMYPRGRRPLLTGGEMRAISIAARAATRVKSNNKRLMSLGLLPKASRRAPAKVAHHHHANGVT